MTRDPIPSIAHTHGVVQHFHHFMGPYFAGPSRIKHFFDPSNPADKRAAMLAARSYLGPLPSGVGVKVTELGSLTLTVRDKEFILLTDEVFSYINAREQVHNELKRARQRK